MKVLHKLRLIPVVCTILLMGSCSVLWDTPYDIDHFYDDPMAPPPPVVRSLPPSHPKDHGPKPPENRPPNNGNNPGKNNRPANGAPNNNPNNQPHNNEPSNGQRPGANTRH